MTAKAAAGKRNTGMPKATRKIEMKKIDDIARRETTFTKRRHGLFSKASELSLLCGAEVAIIVYSPRGDKPFVFGTSSAEDIFQRFTGLTQNPPASNCLMPAPTGERSGEDPVGVLQEVEELESYIEELARLREKVRLRMEELKRAEANAGLETGQGALCRNEALISMQELMSATCDDDGIATTHSPDDSTIMSLQELEEMQICSERVNSLLEPGMSVEELNNDDGKVSLQNVEETDSCTEWVNELFEEHRVNLEELTSCFGNSFEEVQNLWERDDPNVEELLSAVFMDDAPTVTKCSDHNMVLYPHDMPDCCWE